MRVAVVGAGIGGLASGLRLARRGADVLVLEAAPRAGGVIATEEVPAGRASTPGSPSTPRPFDRLRARGSGEPSAQHERGGEPIAWIVEAGPQTVLAGPRLRALAAEVGVEVVPRPPAERRRWLVRGGRLTGPLRALSVRGLARALWGALRGGAPAAEGESVEAYARRRFGEEAARRLFDPLVSGIYAGDPARLEYASALARFGRRRGAESVTFRGGPSASLGTGLQALPAALARALGPERLRLSAPVARVAPAAGGGFEVEVGTAASDGAERLRCDALILACPARAAARLVAPLDGALAAEIEAIRYEAVTAVSLGYDASAFPRGAPRGFGFLAAREEGLPILGCLFCPAPPGKVHLRPMLRGVAAGAEAVARATVERVLGAARPPEMTRVFRHERAIPQYEVGHAARLRRIDERLRALPGLLLAGNAYRGVAVGDVIEDAEAVADACAALGRLAD